MNFRQDFLVEKIFVSVTIFFLNAFNTNLHTDWVTEHNCIFHKIFVKVVCTKTLYNYIELQLTKIKNIDLKQKLRRKHKKYYSREYPIKKPNMQSLPCRISNFITATTFVKFLSR